MKKIILHITVLFLVALKLNAQQNNSGCDSILSIGGKSNGMLKAVVYIDQFPNNAKQFYTDWSTGNVYLTDGKIVHGQLLRYNCYKDELIWLRTKDYKTGIVLKETVDEFIIPTQQGSSIKFRNVKIKLPMQMNSGNIYLQVLAEGKISFYCYRKVKYIKNSTELFYPEYKYFILKDGEYEPVLLKKRSFIKLFLPEEQLVLQEIMRKNKLKVKRETDLIRIIELFNHQQLSSFNSLPFNTAV